MCFAINLYNALCIHTLVVFGPDKYNNSVSRLEFFRKVGHSVFFAARQHAAIWKLLLGYPSLRHPCEEHHVC